MFERNLCAVEWVKVNPQGTTDEFKAYFNGLSEEQRLVCYVFTAHNYIPSLLSQVWEEKSKAIA